MSAAESSRVRAFHAARTALSTTDGATFQDILHLARYIETGRIEFDDEWITERDKRRDAQVVQTIDEAFADNVKILREPEPIGD